MAHIDIHQYATTQPETVFTTELQIKPEVRDKIIHIINEGDKQNYTSNVKACMTDWGMQEQPGFMELEEEFSGIIQHISGIIDGSPPPLQIVNMWGAKYQKGDYTKVHNHWPAVWSGVFYLTVPSDYAGALMFPDLEHHIEPVTGQLVIFNGSTRHGVNTIKSSQERIAISFNYEPMPPQPHLMWSR
jgi:Rps23 Pro-64 3,4-dihydroxylase Tpa1-like proline 4-hydroxylase